MTPPYLTYDHVHKDGTSWRHTIETTCDLANDVMIRPVIERIVWTDSGAFLDKGWASLDVYQRQAREWDGKVETIGRVMFEDDSVVVVGLSHDTKNDEWYGAQLIFKPCIKTRETM